MYISLVSFVRIIRKLQKDATFLHRLRSIYCYAYADDTYVKACVLYEVCAPLYQLRTPRIQNLRRKYVETIVYFGSDYTFPVIQMYFELHGINERPQRV
jgi:hypothetical protein